MGQVTYCAAMPDLLSGRIAMMLDGVPVQTPNIKAGTVPAVAVTTRQRSSSIPEVPTMIESGSPNATSAIYYGMFGPAGLSAAHDLALRGYAVEQSADGVTWTRLMLSNGAGLLTLAVAPPAPGATLRYRVAATAQVGCWWRKRMSPTVPSSSSGPTWA